MNLNANLAQGCLSLDRLHHRVGWIGIGVLMFPILAWVWLVAREPFVSVFSGAVPHYVLSGKLFTEQFDWAHAGFVMDQPTIGKWLFWFSVMAATSLPYTRAVGWVANRKARAGRLAFGIGVSVVLVFLLCILSWPLSWLIQYVWSMGFTPRRAYGLMYAVGGGLVVVGFTAWACRSPARKEEKRTKDHENRG